MSTTQTNLVQVELTYTDYTTRNYKIPIKGELTDDTIDNAKSAIAAFNTAAASASSAVAQTFLSENGAIVGSITNATIIMTTEEELYHA